METTRTYENYPLRIVILSNLVSLTIYGLGFIIIHSLGWLVSVVYLIFILAFEYRLISSHCTGCYYFGWTCGFGKGRLSAIFFKRGDTSKFCNNKFSWKDLIPDLLISFIPLLAGIVILIIDFDIVLLLAVLVLIALTTAGNGYIRGSLTCKYCNQRKLGCPAEKLFNKEIKE